MSQDNEINGGDNGIDPFDMAQEDRMARATGNQEPEQEEIEGAGLEIECDCCDDCPHCDCEDCNHKHVRDDEPDDGMDGDFDSAMASAGHGTDEDYNHWEDLSDGCGGYGDE